MQLTEIGFYVLILAIAGFYIYRSIFKKKGCSCGSSSKDKGCGCS